MTTTERGSRLDFQGAIAGIKLVMPKEQQSHTYGSPSRSEIGGGAMELAFKVERPQPPKEPMRPYELRSEAPAPFTKAEPKKPNVRRKAGESDEDLQKRVDQAENDYDARHEKWTDEKRVRDGQTARRGRVEVAWAAAVAAYNEALAAYPVQLMAYANLTGIIAALGNVKCRVMVEPLVQDLLPGFQAQASLLPAASDAVDRANEALDNAADSYSGYDDDDEDDDDEGGEPEDDE